MSAQSNCLYVAALTERELIQTGTSAPIRAAVLGWREALTDLLRAALPATGPAAELDCEAWADQVFVTFEGAFILCPGHGRQPIHESPTRRPSRRHRSHAAVNPRGHTDLEGPRRHLDGRRAGPVDAAASTRREGRLHRGEIVQRDDGSDVTHVPLERLPARLRCGR